MIPEFGHFTLILAMACSLYATILPVLPSKWVTQGAQIQDNSAHFLVFQVRAATLIFMLLTMSMASLIWSFVHNDFSVAYVAQHSNSKLPMLYQIGAVWGAHEGSMLLWAWILSAWSLAAALLSGVLESQFKSHMLAVLTFIASGFLLFIIITSNPFLRLLPTAPVDGLDLNPLLQDPGLVLHPPVLYMGYVGFAMPFAFALSALWRGELSREWAQWLRPWVISAWCFLTIGITMGSWWAYRELGWGGWWFWDPVENASFLPWLLGTALLHSLMVTAKRGAFTSWTILLAIGCFVLSLIGTFLVRSGVLVSVHAFANDSTRGAYILGFLALVLGMSLSLYAWRGRLLVTYPKLSWLSKESLILANNALLVAAMFTVLLGTVYPLIIDALQLGKLSVGPPYFNTVFVPIMVPLLLLMSLVPMVSWGATTIAAIRSKIFISLMISLFATVLLVWWFTDTMSSSVIFGVMLSLMIISSVWRGRHLGMTLAHLGVAVCALGILLTTVFSVQREVRMVMGDEISCGGYSFLLRSVNDIPGPNYHAIRASVEIFHKDKFLTILQPELRRYTVQETTLAKTSIDAGIFRDLYVALGQVLPNDAFAMRIYYKPFVRWIWAGGFLMLFGGIISALQLVRKRLPFYRQKRVRTPVITAEDLNT